MFGTERDLGVSLIFYVADEEKARLTAQALTAEGIPAFQVWDRRARDQHIYVNWEFLMAKRDPWGRSYPWSLAEGAAWTIPRDLPQTLALLSRAVQIHLNHLVTEEDLRDIEAAINKVAFHLL